MPYAAFLPCRHHRCPNYQVGKSGYCEAHSELAGDYGSIERPRVNYQTANNNRMFMRLRKAFLSHHPICCKCNEPATILDHIEPHRGDLNKFWNQSNWAGMCRRCHDAKTAREIRDRSGASRVGSPRFPR